jgi:hypothetical protein
MRSLSMQIKSYYRTLGHCQGNVKNQRDKMRKTSCYLFCWPTIKTHFLVLHFHMFKNSSHKRVIFLTGNTAIVPLNLKLRLPPDHSVFSVLLTQHESNHIYLCWLKLNIKGTLSWSDTMAPAMNVFGICKILLVYLSVFLCSMLGWSRQNS